MALTMVQLENTQLEFKRTVWFYSLADGPPNAFNKLASVDLAGPLLRTEPVGAAMAGVPEHAVLVVPEQLVVRTGTVLIHVIVALVYFSLD